MFNESNRSKRYKHKSWHVCRFLSQPWPLLPAGLTGPVWSWGRRRHKRRAGRGWEQQECSGILAHPSNIWWTDRDTELRRRESERWGRSQICCLAQDQSQDKVINLKQDVSPLTVYFIFRVCGQRVSKNPNTQRRAELFGLTWGSPPCTERVETVSPPGSVGGWDIFFLFW